MKVKYINLNMLIELKEKNTETYNNLKEKFPEFDLWIEQKDYPTYNQLLELSKIFNVPFGYFFLEKLPTYEKPKSIFISGAISNDPDYINKFKYWKNVLQNKFPNSEIKSPIEFVKIKNGTEKEIWADAMIQSLNILKDCTDIFLIPENIESIGKNIETQFAEYLGLNFISLN